MSVAQPLAHLVEEAGDAQRRRWGAGFHGWLVLTLSGWQSRRATGLRGVPTLQFENPNPVELKMYSDKTRWASFTHLLTILLRRFGNAKVVCWTSGARDWG